MRNRLEKNNAIKNLLRLGILFALFSSCNKFENLPSPAPHLAYYPLVIDAVNYYNVDSTVYNDFNSSTTVYNFKIKDTIIAKYTDALGDEAYRVERFKKEGTKDWEFQKVISRKIINNRAEEVLDNKRYVRLVFPPRQFITWNGNLYNDLEAWQHEIVDIHQPLVLGNLTLDSTISVKQYEEINLIREDIYTETYAKNIGLVVKEVTAIDKDISSGRIKKGYVYKMQLHSHK